MATQGPGSDPNDDRSRSTASCQRITLLICIAVMMALAIALMAVSVRMCSLMNNEEYADRFVAMEFAAFPDESKEYLDSCGEPSNCGTPTYNAMSRVLIGETVIGFVLIITSLIGLCAACCQQPKSFFLFIVLLAILLVIETVVTGMLIATYHTMKKMVSALDELEALLVGRAMREERGLSEWFDANFDLAAMVKHRRMEHLRGAKERGNNDPKQEQPGGHPWVKTKHYWPLYDLQWGRHRNERSETDESTADTDLGSTMLGALGKVLSDAKMTLNSMGEEVEEVGDKMVATGKKTGHKLSGKMSQMMSDWTLATARLSLMMKLDSTKRLLVSRRLADIPFKQIFTKKVLKPMEKYLIPAIAAAVVAYVLQIVMIYLSKRLVDHMEALARRRLDPVMLQVPVQLQPQGAPMMMMMMAPQASGTAAKAAPQALPQQYPPKITYQPCTPGEYHGRDATPYPSTIYHSTEEKHRDPPPPYSSSYVPSPAIEPSLSAFRDTSIVKPSVPSTVDIGSSSQTNDGTLNQVRIATPDPLQKASSNISLIDIENDDENKNTLLPHKTDGRRLTNPFLNGDGTNANNNNDNGSVVVDGKPGKLSERLTTQLANVDTAAPPSCVSNLWDPQTPPPPPPSTPLDDKVNKL